MFSILCAHVKGCRLAIVELYKILQSNNEKRYQDMVQLDGKINFEIIVTKMILNDI